MCETESLQKRWRKWWWCSLKMLALSLYWVNCMCTHFAQYMLSFVCWCIRNSQLIVYTNTMMFVSQVVWLRGVGKHIWVILYSLFVIRTTEKYAIIATSENTKLCYYNGWIWTSYWISSNIELIKIDLWFLLSVTFAPTQFECFWLFLIA